MKFKKTLAILNVIFSVSILSACTGGQGTSSTNSSSKSMLQLSVDNEIKISDLALIGGASNQCNYSSAQPLIICSSDNSVCGKLTLCPNAEYMPGVGGKAYWTKAETPVTGNSFSLQFNKDIRQSSLFYP